MGHVGGLGGDATGEKSQACESSKHGERAGISKPQQTPTKFRRREYINTTRESEIVEGGLCQGSQTPTAKRERATEAGRHACIKEKDRVLRFSAPQLSSALLLSF